jgi:hypothetical protein
MQNPLRGFCITGILRLFKIAAILAALRNKKAGH